MASTSKGSKRAGSPTHDGGKGELLKKFYKPLLFGTPEVLQPQVLGEDIIITVPNVFSSDECDSIIKGIDEVGLNEATGADKNPKKGEAYLDRESLAIRDPALSAAVWERLKQVVPCYDGRAPVGLYEKCRLYCYRKGQRFDQHVDTSVKDEDGNVSEYTLLIYLNGGPDDPLPIEGGETVFYATAKKILASIAPIRGTAVLHAHGRRCLMHCGAAVTKGTKYVFRSEIMYEPVAVRAAPGESAPASASAKKSGRKR